jgi:hypothetical protein
MRPAQELLASQVPHDVRDVVIVGLEGEHNCEDHGQLAGVEF